MKALTPSGRPLLACFPLALAVACSGAPAGVLVTDAEALARCRDLVAQSDRIYELPDPEAQDAPASVERDIEPPEKLEAPQPRFPRQSRLRWAEVRIRAVIDTEGRVVCPEVVEATAPQFARALLDVLPRWRFRPARLDGRPEPVYYELTTTFRLGGI